MEFITGPLLGKMHPQIIKIIPCDRLDRIFIVVFFFHGIRVSFVFHSIFRQGLAGKVTTSMRKW
jgi:uncharacterized protein with PQ loop repeat